MCASTAHHYRPPEHKKEQQVYYCLNAGVYGCSARAAGESAGFESLPANLFREISAYTHAPARIQASCIHSHIHTHTHARKRTYVSYYEETKESEERRSEGRDRLISGVNKVRVSTSTSNNINAVQRARNSRMSSKVPIVEGRRGDRLSAIYIFFRK